MADIFTGRLREEIPAALEAFLPALATCPALHTVDLSDNAFGPTAAAPLERFFSTHAPLAHLFLQNNGMGPEAGARMADALARNEGARLRTVVCGRNRLENGSVPAWVRCFAAHADTLTVVKMPQNGIRPEGIETLLRDGLARCEALEVLDLQDNTFTRRGSVALANAVPLWPDLEELAVGDCLLSARGGRVLADALKTSSSSSSSPGGGSHAKLAVLRLQYNEIDAVGLRALGDAIELGLPGLVRLELNGNKFGEDDAALDRIRELFEARGHGGTIDDLDDLEEDDSEDDEDNDDDDENDAASDGEDEKTVKGQGKPALSALDAAIEKNLASALNATSLDS